MKRQRIAGLSRRVMLQIFRDRWTFVLLIALPILLLVLADLMFESEAKGHTVGLVNMDAGLSLPGGRSISFGDDIEKSMAEDPGFVLRPMKISEVEPFLKRSRVKAVVVIPEDFTASFVRTGEMVLNIDLEGSNPGLTGPLLGNINQIAATAIVRAAASGGLPESALPTLPISTDKFPVRIDTEFYYGGQEFGPMDYVAPVYIAFLVLFFVFLITCVSLIQERTHGTMERLLATPASRFEIIAGYIIGLGVYAFMQGGLIVVFSVFVLRIVYAGSLALLFVIIVILAVVGVALGMLASSFAKNEFQVVQYIPLLIIPQMLLGGTLIPVEDLHPVLKPLAYAMPLTYANFALRDVMIRGWGIVEIFPNVLILAGFAALFILLDVLAVRREID